MNIFRRYRRSAVAPLLALATSLLIVALNGCGGGGGGGGATPPPDPTPKNPPVQSGWSPPKNSTINTTSRPVTFTTDVSASCRWSLQDFSYDSMTSGCSAVAGSNHTCNVSGLFEGAAIVYISCAGTAGGKDTAETNDDIPYTVDTIKPVVSISYPVDGSEFSLVSSPPPSYVTANYSDSGTGVSVETLAATYTVAGTGRTIDITSLFGKDAAANASTSTTSAAETDPLGRTTVARFSNSSFVAPTKSWAFPRGGRRSLRLAPAGAGKALVWNTADKNVSVINISQGVSALLATLPANPVAVVASPVVGRFYAVYAGDKTFYSYFLSNGAVAGSMAIPGLPTALAYDTALDRVYISYSDVQQIGAWNCQLESLGVAINLLDHTPVMLEAWSDGSVRVVTVANEIAGMKAVRVDTNGTRLNSVVVGQQQPRGLLAIAGIGHIFASVTTPTGSEIAAVNTANNVLTHIAGAGPGRIFADFSGQAIAINEDQSKASVINTSALTASTGVSLGAPPSDGMFDASTGSYLIADDLFLLPSIPITITATITDRAGNIGTASVSITMHPESNGQN